MFRGRTSQQAKAPAQSAPTIVSPAGVESAPTMPKVKSIESQTAIPSNPFAGGSPAQITINLPQDLGKVTDLVAQFTMTFSTTDTSGCDIAVVPSPFFVDYYQILVDGQDHERIDASELFAESAQWVNDQWFSLNNSAWNISSTGGYASAFNLANETATSTKVWYLPLNSNFLMRMKPYIAGFANRFAIRLTLRNDITVTVKKTGTNTATTCAVSLDDLRLYATEEWLGEAGEAHQRAAHQRNALYRTIKRNKFTSGLYTSVSNTADLKVQLSTLKGDAAGLLVYFAPQAPTISQLLTHYELSTIGLRDSKNNEITEQLPAKVVERQASRFLPISSAMINSSPSNNYILAFGRNLQEPLETGKFVGGLSFGGQESVSVKPLASLSNVVLTAVAYDYVNVACVGGRFVLRNGATQ